MINLIMPMAGRGSRFSKSGYVLPKPLVELNGKPFFWWAITSITRTIDIKTLTCVVLKEHITEFELDKKILNYFPNTQFVILDEVTDGALETAIQGVRLIDNELPIVINDCDHAFEIGELPDKIQSLVSNDTHYGYLCHFESNSHAYSYAKYNSSGCLTETVEKKVISNLAIAGAYIFKSKDVILRYYNTYSDNCNYDELFISGLYNFMINDKRIIKGILLDSHLSFGTPEELGVASKHNLYLNW